LEETIPDEGDAPSDDPLPEEGAEGGDVVADDAPPPAEEALPAEPGKYPQMIYRLSHY